MLLFIIPILVFLIAAIWWTFEIGWDPFGLLCGYGMSLVAAFVALFLTYLVLWPFSAWMYNEDQALECHEGERAELVQLNDFIGTDGDVRGGLFAVYGGVDSSAEFSFYQKNADGTFKFDTIDAEYTTVHEKVDAAPSVTTTECFDPMLRMSTKEDNGFLGYLVPYIGSGSWSYSYDLTVPSGSIGVGIKLDGN